MVDSKEADREDWKLRVLYTETSKGIPVEETKKKVLFKSEIIPLAYIFKNIFY